MQKLLDHIAKLKHAQAESARLFKLMVPDLVATAREHGLEVIVRPISDAPKPEKAPREAKVIRKKRAPAQPLSDAVKAEALRLKGEGVPRGEIASRLKLDKKKLDWVLYAKAAKKTAARLAATPASPPAVTA